ncbi:MAG: hypothetical protein OXK17_06765 [Thaumarchaeota archaeon]|nr:hypothetical protein [Nitrososphaerota archaeon]
MRGCAVYQSTMHIVDLTCLSDALPYSTRYNSEMGRENMDAVMLDAYMNNCNAQGHRAWSR